MRYAIVENDEVVNIILWGGDDYTLEPECEFYEVPEEVSIGWTLQGEEFVAPEAEIVNPPSESPEVTSAKEIAAQELITLGVSEATARTIVGLP